MKGSKHRGIAHIGVIDPGHEYELITLDGGFPQILRFVKREGKNYPGNLGHYPGTTLQCVLRVLIDRIVYLDRQKPCKENKDNIKRLEQCVLALEKRAARRHKRPYKHNAFFAVNAPMCIKCGHTDCKCKV